ncbi:MAG: TetR/AcrR family transcriptional regulator [Coriobacteriia bacterium]|nr:TetR/AcrR family transcriptional regulator [Coriobacteriia bacterium]
MIARAAGSGESRETLNRERVVRAAMDLADESGIDSVTMRELGRRLGVEAASLYNHVAGKDDLLSGMADLAAAEIDLPSSDVDWKEAMRRRAVSAREVFVRHRWAAGLMDSRVWSGPYSLLYADRVLGTLIHAGFSPVIASWAFIALDGYIYGFERQRSNFSPSEDVDTIEVAQDVLAAIPPGAHPSLAAVAMEYAEEPYDEEAAFEFGLDLILDSLERRLGADSLTRR